MGERYGRRDEWERGVGGGMNGREVRDEGDEWERGAG